MLLNSCRSNFDEIRDYLIRAQVLELTRHTLMSGHAEIKLDLLGKIVVAMCMKERRQVRMVVSNDLQDSQKVKTEQVSTYCHMSHNIREPFSRVLIDLVGGFCCTRQLMGVDMCSPSWTRVHGF